MSLQKALQEASPNFTKTTALESANAIYEFVRKWLVESGITMPTKDEVLKYVDEAFDTYVGPMFKRKLVRAAANELLLIAVGELYDSLAANA